MDTPLQIETSVIANIDAVLILGKILRKVEELGQIDEQYNKLKYDVQLLQNVLISNARMNTTLQMTTRLRSCLRGVNEFVEDRLEAHWGRRAVHALTGNPGYLDLKAEVLHCVAFYTAECIVSIGNSRSPLCLQSPMTRRL